MAAETKGTCGTCVYTFATADTLRIRRILGWIYAHVAHLLAGFAADAGTTVTGELEQRNPVEKRIDGA